jgi:hypothetical protein
MTEFEHLTDKLSLAMKVAIEALEKAGDRKTLDQITSILAEDAP